MPPLVRLFTVAVVVALLLPALAAACPLCKEATSDADTPGGTASLGRGFYYSILLMVTAPFAVVGTLAFVIVRSRRRSRARVAGIGGEPPDPMLVPPREARP